jgi:COP9 signalosome complex subunit 1
MIQELKKGLNVDFYMQTVDAFAKLSPTDPLASIDTDWAEAATRRAKVNTDRLEHELKQYKNNLIKESIRMGQEDLGNHYFELGDYSAAFKAYSKMREFCTTQKQIAQMTFKLLYVSVMQRNWVIATSYQPKIGALQLSPEDKAKYEPILFACVGLAHLQQSNYREAARSFLNVDQQYMVSQEPQGSVVFQKQVMTPNDVAVYGGLCALATMDRAELQRRVLDNTSFRPLLELEPHIRRAISMFCSSKYTGCLQVLESYMADYVLDYYLNSEFLRLYTLVRHKCIVQWFSAYSKVTWQEIETQFPNSLLEVPLDQELRDMIRNGDLDARVDLVDKVSLARPCLSPCRVLRC